ncbi:MAG: M1 family aminopeptidase [Ignavibacteria bacterium]|nr:M1 family aminopeptidase [Ignavibacteria bacterium]
MNKFTLIIILLITFISISFGQELQVKGSDYCSLKKSRAEYTPLLKGETGIPNHTFDVLNYKLYLDIYNCFLSPYPKSFNAYEIITFKVDSTLNSIQLNAVNSSLVINSVSLAGVSFNHTNNILTINLNRTYFPGEVVNVRIDYNHLNVNDNAFYASNGMVFTDCEPEGARKWFPCWDKPSDKATLDLTARVPATVKLGSNGRLADSIKTGDTIYYNWISRDPIATYLIVISAKVNYGLDIIYWTKPSTGEQIPIRFYYNIGENITSIKPKVLSMTNRFSELFGEHPFEKNGFATLNSQFPWGGMENQTLTSLCPNCWSENLISHEYAHQWFGDMITCATWADIGLNEGFATYCEALWYEYTSGYTAYKNDIVSDANQYISSNPGWPIYNPSWAITTPPNSTLFNTAITYNKGACVLHMLRYVLGDSTFFACIKAYATDTVGYKFKSVTFYDWLAKVNQVSGKDMTWFFDQWIFKPNHPVYQNTYSINSIGSGKWIVGFTARQTQSNPPFFKMPIELKITFTSGPDTLIRVMNEVNNQTFGFVFNRQPTSVTFDPNNDIVLKQGTTTQGTMLCKPIEVAEDWNMISIPLTAPYMLATGLFPNAKSYPYGYINGYVQADTFVNGKGYWLKFGSNQSLAVCGTAVATNSINVNSGWNLIGPYDKDVPVSQITSAPPGIISSSFFGYDAGYQPSTTLQTGKGYWIKVNQSGTINYNTTLKIADNPILSFYKIQDDWGRIIIEDKKGRKKILYLTNQSSNLDKYELPPAPPTGIFDIRFNSDRYVENFSKRNLEIQLNSASYPLKIKVENCEIKLTDKFGGKFFDKYFTSGDEYSIENSEVRFLQLEPKFVIPSKFELLQNYPNPFNSTTSISFTIAKESNVKIEIFNLIGQKISTLLDNNLDVGFHTIKFSAENFSSGIYLVKMKASDFEKTVKMALLK